MEVESIPAALYTGIGVFEGARYIIGAGAVILGITF